MTTFSRKEVGDLEEKRGVAIVKAFLRGVPDEERGDVALKEERGDVALMTIRSEGDLWKERGEILWRPRGRKGDPVRRARQRRSKPLSR